MTEASRGRSEAGFGSDRWLRLLVAAIAGVPIALANAGQLGAREVLPEGNSAFLAAAGITWLACAGTAWRWPRACRFVGCAAIAVALAWALSLPLGPLFLEDVNLAAWVVPPMTLVIGILAILAGRQRSRERTRAISMIARR